MTYELSRLTGTSRLGLLYGWAIGMNKHDKPLSPEDVHYTAEMLMAELDAAIREIEADLDRRHIVVDTAYCGCGTCQQIRLQQGRDPLETVAESIGEEAHIPEGDWYDPVIRDPSLYQDGFCDEHGDTATIYRHNAWRCVICGRAISVSEPQEL